MITLRFRSSFKRDELKQLLKGLPDFVRTKEEITQMKKERAKHLFFHLIISILVLTTGIGVTYLGVKDPFNFHRIHRIVFIFLPFALLIGGIALCGAAVYWFIDRFMSAFFPINQSSPEKLLESFYLDTVERGNYAKVFSVVVPNLPDAYFSNFAQFKNNWRKLPEILKSYLMKEVVTCIVCNVTKKGFAPKDKWKFAHGYEGISVVCPTCQAYICLKHLFAELANSGKCPRCDSSLKGYLDILITDPNKITLIPQVSSIKINSQVKEEETYEGTVSIKWTGEYRRTFSEKAYQLGEEGTITCIFENLAVQRERMWYLIPPTLNDVCEQMESNRTKQGGEKDDES